MKKLFLVLNLFFTSFFTEAQVSVDIDVTPYGSLSNALMSTGVDPNMVTELRVMGGIGMADFFYMNDQMPQLTKIDLGPAYIIDIMPSCFQGNQKLLWISLPHNVQEISPFTFKDCINLEWIHLPYSLKKIGDFAFYGCTRLYRLENMSYPYSLPEFLTEIGNEAFADCNNLYFGELYLPPSLKTIGFGAFHGSFYFNEKILRIPSSVTSISDGAFCGRNFKHVIVENPIPFSIGEFVICLSTIDNALIVPKGAVNAYRAATNWSNFLTIIEPIVISFDSQGGTSVASIYDAIYNEFYWEPIAPTKVNYIFGGWYKEPSCINKWDFYYERVRGSMTLYAKWYNPVNTVSFNSNGGSDVSSVSVNFNTIISSPITPTKVGHTFGGWCKDSDLTTFWIFSTDKVIENTTLYAKWIINTFTVSFNAQGGSAVADITTDYNSIISEPSAPTRTGYTFGGWYKESGLTNPWNFTTDKVADNTTLYAKWTINTYTITFDAQGGSAVANITADYNTTISEPSAPTRTGYTFGGWYKESGLTNPWSFVNDKVTDNTTLYAKWNINSYTVNFDAQGGSTVADISTDYNSIISEPSSPTKTGYTFGGWYKESGLTNLWDFEANRVTENTTLYAKWTIISYTVNFDTQGGSAVASTSANYNTTIAEPAAPTRTGYTIGGWYKESGLTNPWNFTADKVTENTTLYAKWTINSYSVSFDSQGGSAVAGVNANYNTSIAEPAAPTRTGYTFGGWYKESGLTNPWNFTADKVAENTTLYAKWTINSYSVSFDSQGGSAVAGVNANYNTSIAEPASPTRMGYTFGGWYKELGLTNPWSFVNDKVTENTTLYAKWEISNSIDNLSKSNFKLYPNPALDYVNIEGDNVDEIYIVNMQGKVLKDFVVGSKNLYSFYVGDLLGGSYVVIMRTKDGKVLNIKLIKN